MTTTDFTGFYHAHFANTVTLVYSFTADMPAAQDVTQEAFARAWQRWPVVSGYDNPLAWVRRVSVNLANARWRRLRTMRLFLERQREEYEAELNPDHVAVVAALRKLPRNHREAIVLHYLADMPVDEVAEHLDAPLGTVKSWLHRGRAALAESLVIELPAVTTPPADQIIKRGTQRRRVRTAGIAAATVLLLTGAVFGVGRLVRTPDEVPVTPPSGSPSVSLPAGCLPGQVPVSLLLPDSESDIKVDVFNGTDIQGLATTVATDLRNRKFTVGRVETAQEPNEDLAIVRYGPKTIGAAQIINAYLLREGTMVFELGRSSDTVDLVVGKRFRQLAGPTEMRQAIALMGRPALPQGTCALPE